MTEECKFCNNSLMMDDVLWESDNFFVKVGIGILAPGHVMLITKKHLSCFGELPGELIKEFLSLKKGVFNRIKSNFSEPIIYEQGVYSQSVNHAHLHFLPKKGDLYNIENIGGKIFRELESIDIRNFSQIIDFFKKEGSYIYLEENGQKFIFHTKDLPDLKYTFRREFAKLTGLGLIQWHKMTEDQKKMDIEWIKNTKDVLKIGLEP